MQVGNRVDVVAVAEAWTSRRAVLTEWTLPVGRRHRGVGRIDPSRIELGSRVLRTWYRDAGCDPVQLRRLAGRGAR